MLTVAKIKASKPREKPYKVFDERGLYLLVNPNKSRWWRFKYRYGNKEKLLSLGTYPDTSLKQARNKRDLARQLLDKNIDPSARRSSARATQADTFAGIAQEWLDMSSAPKSGGLSPSTVRQLDRRLKKHVLPYIGGLSIADITASDVLALLRRIESKGLHETAHRVRALCSRVFKYAVITGRASHDVATDLKGALSPVKSTHFAAITEPREIGALMRAIDGYEGHPSVTFALRLAPLLFVRPGELRGAQWIEFDLDSAEWRIPDGRMKMGRLHIVPLAKQAVSILTDLRAVNGSGRYLFPSLRSKDRTISENTLNAALRRLGYPKEQMTAHGFRTMASTRLNELGYDPDVIELQLAHTDSNKIRAAYNRATKLAERRKLMQGWADYLDGLKADSGSKLTELRRGAA